MRLPVMKSQQTIQLTDGRIIGFAEYGDPNGHPVFYFHGFPGSRLEAERFHDYAEKNGYRIIGIDRPGYGLSTFAQNRSLLNWPDDVKELADSLKVEKFSIMGHSAGAPFVLACALLLPHRLNRAAIVSGMAPFDKPESNEGLSLGHRVANWLIKRIPSLSTPMMVLTQLMLKNPNKMLEQMVKQLPAVDQDQFRDPAKAAILLNGVTEAFRNGLAGAALEMRLLLSYPWGFELENIEFPILIWHGKLDTQVPLQHALIYKKYLPNSQLKVFDNEGHHSLIQNQMGDILNALQVGHTSKDQTETSPAPSQAILPSAKLAKAPDLNHSASTHPMVTRARKKAH